MDSMEASWLADTVNFESCLYAVETPLLTINADPLSKNNNDFLVDFSELRSIMNMEDDDDYSSLGCCFSSSTDLPPDNSTTTAAVMMPPQTPAVLNFEKNGGKSGDGGGAKSRALKPEEEALVSRALRGCDGNFNIKDKLSCVEVERPKRKRVRLPLQNLEHVVAERNRREQLNRKFLHLSHLVPGLKKLDKASVLGDTITYMKHLEDKVKKLEEEHAAKYREEPFVTVKKSKVTDEEGEEEVSGGGGDARQRSLEATAYKNRIVVRIQCERRKGALIDIHLALESCLCWLNVLSTNINAFGSFVLHVTVVAEMDTTSLTVEEVVKRLRRALSSVGVE